MKLVIIGANGNTGREVISNATWRGYEVVAAVRRPETLRDVDGVTISKIDITDSASMADVFKEADAVISTIGHGGLKASALPTTLYSDATRAIREAMLLSNVKRIVVLSSAGVVEDKHAPWYYRLLLRRYLINTYIDMGRMETILEEDQNLNWTSVRLTYLLEGKSKSVLAKEGRIGQGSYKIHYQDAAKFILDCIEHGEWIGGHPVIGYEK